MRIEKLTTVIAVYQKQQQQAEKRLHHLQLQYQEECERENALKKYIEEYTVQPQKDTLSSLDLSLKTNTYSFIEQLASHLATQQKRVAHAGRDVALQKKVVTSWQIKIESIESLRQSMEKKATTAKLRQEEKLLDELINMRLIREQDN